VRKLEKQTMQSADTVQIETHAAASLRYIRNSMESATSFALPGSAGVAMGAVGLLAAVLSSAPSMQRHWFLIWLIAAVVAGGLGGSLVIRPSSLRGLALSGTPIRKFAFCLLPSMFGGAVLTGVLWSYGNLNAIPGTWLLLYGCALIAASVPTTRTIGIMGGLFVGLGLLAFLLPDRLQILLLGIGFGGLHVLFGFLIGRMGHGSEV
jgi:hypothetical protein